MSTITHPNNVYAVRTGDRLLGYYAAGSLASAINDADEVNDLENDLLKATLCPRRTARLHREYRQHAEVLECIRLSRGSHTQRSTREAFRHTDAIVRILS